MIQSINPATGELIQEFAVFTPEEVDQTLAQADKAYKEWRKTGYAQRTELMLKAAEYLRTHKTELAKIIVNEVGKTLAAAEAEVEKSATACDYYGKNIEKIFALEYIQTEATESYVRFDPIGPVLAIMPWNFPFWQVFRFAAPALMAGNVGILKHASNVQLSAQAIVDVFKNVGFPEGVFTNLVVATDMIADIIRDDRVVAVTLTGSEYAGSQTAKVAGESLKKTVLELGGSDAFIVRADADVDAAAEAAVVGRMQFNAGQSCVAAKRFIVHQDVAEAFLEKLKVNVEKLKMGDPLDPETSVGPLATEKMCNEVSKQVAESVEQGARVVSGGKAVTPGYFYQPTILSDIKPSMTAWSQEVFGPVLPVMIVADDAEAIAVANDSPHGLSSVIFTADVEKAKELAAQIEAGSVFINQPTRSDIRLPFGGVKKSGYGREMSHYGIKEFVNIKTVVVK